VENRRKNEEYYEWEKVKKEQKVEDEEQQERNGNSCRWMRFKLCELRFIE
jgi:hypothetical protein